MSFLISPMLSLQEKWRTRGLNSFCQEPGEGRRSEEVVQRMHTYVSVKMAK
jgi:hypothetical protein